MQAQTEVVQCQVHIAASKETVFSFWTDPEKMVRWQGISASLDPQRGGEFHVDLGPGITIRGKFLEVSPYDRIVLSFGWEGSPGVPPESTRVEIELTEEAGGTLLTLRHSGLPKDEREMHTHGWNHFLARLVIAAPGGDPGPNTMPGQ